MKNEIFVLFVVYFMKIYYCTARPPYLLAPVLSISISSLCDHCHRFGDQEDIIISASKK